MTTQQRTERYKRLLEAFITSNPSSPYYGAVIDVQCKDKLRRVSSKANPIGSRRQTKRVGSIYTVTSRFPSIPGSTEVVRVFEGK